MAEPKTETVTLAAPHTHAGEKLAKGAKIQVTPERLAWLKKFGVIAAESTANLTTQSAGVNQ